jgi:hypothetical protein
MSPLQDGMQTAPPTVHRIASTKCGQGIMADGQVIKIVAMTLVYTDAAKPFDTKEFTFTISMEGASVLREALDHRRCHGGLCSVG